MNLRDLIVTCKRQIPMDAFRVLVKKRAAHSMPRLLHALAPAFIFSFTSLFATAARAADCAADVLAEMNLARTQPQAYAQIVAQTARPGREGDRAIQEAVRFLQKARPLPPLADCDALRSSARDHVLDSGSRGMRGHNGSDGSRLGTRIDRYGRWMGSIGENISYGQNTARAVVIQLIVDDGVRGRGHRANIFHKGFRLVGIASGPHASYGSMVVTDFAQDLTPAGGRIAKL